MADRWLIHAPLHGVTALVNRAAVCRLREGLATDPADPFSDLAALIQAEPASEPRPHDGLLRPEFLGLIPARGCNLACAYCCPGVPGPVTDTMETALAAAAVDWYAGHVKDSGGDTLAVHFPGGEPFCAPDVVDVAVHRTRARAAEYRLRPELEVATNGNFDEDRCRFVADHFHTVVLSLDGPEEVHERHRPARGGHASYAVVARNARTLGAGPADLSLRACVTADTTGSLPAITSWLCTTFAPSSIVFETPQPTPESVAAGLRPPDPWRFAADCVHASAVASELGVTPIYAAAAVDEIRHSSCPVGRDAVIVSPDGRAGACCLNEQDWTARGLDLGLGRLDAAGTLVVDTARAERVRRLSVDRPRCRSCFARWHCAGGCHVDHSYPGCPAAYDDLCIQTRIITASRLLGDLGKEEDAARLLADRRSLERLALRRSDCLDDWEPEDD